MGNIIVDVDDVIIDWNNSFVDFVTKKGFLLDRVRHTWTLQQWTNHPRIEDLVLEFNHSPEFETLPPISGAFDVLNEFSKKGFQVYALSSCTDNKDAIERRITNVKTHYPFIEEVVCLPLGSDKFRALRRYPRGSFWIEDRYENAEAGLQAGHRSIILNRPYNMYGDHPEITRCDDWDSIKDCIIEELNNE